MTVADVRAAKRAGKKSPAASKQDLRAWLEALRAAGEVQEINGAEREAEIGGIVDLYMRKMGNPAVLFDDIPGYPRGHRILANILTSVRRINLTLGMPIDGSAIELVSYWRKYMKEARSIPPVTVKSGPLLENVSTGKDVNIQTIPTPRWHEHDGGYYIGTGCMVIMRDPDTGWINYGAYRVQSHGPERGDRHVLQGQARRSDQAPLSRARRAVPGRGRGRHASGAVHGGRARNSLRQERIRRGRRSDRRAGRGDQGAAHRAADSGAGGDRLRGLRASRTI